MGGNILRGITVEGRRLALSVRAGSAAVLFLLLAAAPASSQSYQTQSYEIDASIDWQTGVLTLLVEAAVPVDRFNAPTVGYRVEQQIERDLPEILVQSLLQLPVDSRFRIQDRLRRTPELVQELGNLFRRGRKEYTRRSLDLRRIEVRYSFQLFPDIAGIFFSHTRPFPVDRVIRWVPTRPYTGIVIYAKGELPVHGTRERARLEPCLYPEIYDDQMRLVLERLMVRPDAVRRWGVAAYTDEVDEGPWISRIGQSPIRILAGGIFGSIPTDIKIPVEQADRILASDHNRRLLTEGRILIIIESESLSPPLQP
jgi:hypothetical protein